MSQPLGLFLPYLLPFVSPRTPSAPLPHSQRPPSPRAPGHPRTTLIGGRFLLGSPGEGARSGGEIISSSGCAASTHIHTRTASLIVFSRSVEIPEEAPRAGKVGGSRSMPRAALSAPSPSFPCPDGQLRAPLPLRCPVRPPERGEPCPSQTPERPGVGSFPSSPPPPRPLTAAG